jgi:hypothetical protein
MIIKIVRSKTKFGNVYNSLRKKNSEYSSASVSAGYTFQHLPRLRETADNTERYT